MKFRFCGDQDCPEWVLAEISNISLMSPERLEFVVVQIVSFCLNGDFDYEKIVKIATDNVDGISDIKGAIAAIHFIIANAAKYDVNDKSLIQEIQQLGLPEDSSDVVTNKYREAREQLRKKFADESYRLTKLISVDWRVDHIIASSSSSVADASNGPLVHLKLKVDKRPELGSLGASNETTGDTTRTRDIAFELSAEKLDVLIHELSQAQKLMSSINGDTS